MSKYIDADLLRKEIEKRKNICNGVYERDSDTYYQGKAVAYQETLSLIDSLQQEQPAQPKINRCRDCEHRKIGKCSMRNQWWESSYCELKPKTIGGVSGFFYSVQDSKVACENFMEREESHE